MTSGSKETIVVVDDDQGILDSFDVMLGEDYPLVMVKESEKALEMIEKENPRLLFLDIKMPGINGMELLQLIRRHEISAEIVIVTALAQTHYEEMALLYGVYRYLKKPLDVDEVESIARAVLH